MTQSLLEPLPTARRAHRTTQRHAIILAGGRGTRLEEMTRKLTGKPTPKQFCSFTADGETLLQRTARRASRVAAGAMRVVVSNGHSVVAQQQLEGHGTHRLLAQPLDRGTALGLLFALVDLLVDAPEAQVVVLPADHGFGDEDVLADAVDAAFEETRARPERVTLLAAEADRAATDYGWIMPEGGAGGGAARRISRFVEKPDAPTAKRLLEAGGSWSTMMMVANARALLDLFSKREPMLVKTFFHQAALPPGERELFLERTYELSRSVDLSSHVLENAEDLWMMPLPRAAGWSDLGTEDRMHAWLRTQSEAAPGPKVARAGVTARASTAPGQLALSS